MWDTRGRTGAVTKNGYLLKQIEGVRQYEHRRVMEGVLGRKLQPKENVHHKNGNKLDNSPANLELLSINDHLRYHAKQNGLGKDRVGIEPTNKTSKEIINLIYTLRKEGKLLREIVQATHLSIVTVQKYARQAIKR